LAAVLHIAKEVHEPAFFVEFLSLVSQAYGKKAQEGERDLFFHVLPSLSIIFDKLIFEYHEQKPLNEKQIKNVIKFYSNNFLPISELHLICKTFEQSLTSNHFKDLQEFFFNRIRLQESVKLSSLIFYFQNLCREGLFQRKELEEVFSKTVILDNSFGITLFFDQWFKDPVMTWWHPRAKFHYELFSVWVGLNRLGKDEIHERLLKAGGLDCSPNPFFLSTLINLILFRPMEEQKYWFDLAKNTFSIDLKWIKVAKSCLVWAANYKVEIECRFKVVRALLGMGEHPFVLSGTGKDLVLSMLREVYDLNECVGLIQIAFQDGIDYKMVLDQEQQMVVRSLISSPDFLVANKLILLEGLLCGSKIEPSLYEECFVFLLNACVKKSSTKYCDYIAFLSLLLHPLSPLNKESVTKKYYVLIRDFLTNIPIIHIDDVFVLRQRYELMESLIEGFCFSYKKSRTSVLSHIYLLWSKQVKEERLKIESKYSAKSEGFRYSTESKREGKREGKRVRSGKVEEDFRKQFLLWKTLREAYRELVSLETWINEQIKLF
jgi:hypothetical protein